MDDEFPECAGCGGHFDESELVDGENCGDCHDAMVDACEWPEDE